MEDTKGDLSKQKDILLEGSLNPSPLVTMFVVYVYVSESNSVL